ncbi:MAG: acyltransferase family protein [Gammaproteobacteria bacterium]
MRTPADSLPGIDLAKALASQVILWHHFALYGPMSAAVAPMGGAFWDWLAGPLRWAVQIFLVTAGYLAGRSLLPAPWAPRPSGGAARWRQRLGQRTLRLGQPFWLAMLVAIGAAALARALITDADTPAAPTAVQVLAHLLFLQDIVGQTALSAGVWYVAIDWQLYALMATLVAVLGTGWSAAATVAGLTVLSIFWFNRVDSGDVWATYFMAAYGLGMMAWWVSALRASRWPGVLLIAVLVLAGLFIEWRPRLALAGLMACWLALGGAALPQVGSHLQTAVAALARWSYAVFLLHYPVVLAIGAVIAWRWPGQVLPAVAGLMASWALSLALGAALTEWLAYRTSAQGKP